MVPNWEQVFPDQAYRFYVGLRKGDAARFYAPTSQRESLLAQRRLWLETSPQDYCALGDDGAALLDEAVELAARWQSLSPDDLAAIRDVSVLSLPDEREPRLVHLRQCLELALRWEPDFLLLRPDTDGLVRLVGGAVCFPSWWALREKLGLPLTEIHGIVPGLNAVLGGQIQTFLARLAPGVSWERENWGLARTPELNLHPLRNLPRLKPPLVLGEVWLRVEHQSFVALPQSRGILFGIRLKVHPLAEIAQDRAAAHRLQRALATMPEDVARYKGLAEAREDLLRILSQKTPS